MKLENQVCTIEQAKRLKELGIDGGSHFYHVPWKASDFEGCFIGAKCDKGFYHDLDGMVETFDAPEYYPAFTVAELGAMLPDQTKTNSNIEFAELFIKYDGEWVVGYDVDMQTEGGYGATVKEAYRVMYGETEAQARAAMLIHLLENNLTTASDCNNRLNA